MKAHRLVAIGIISASAVAAVALACTGLSDFPLNACGNSIIEQEAGEQCDTIPIEGFACFARDAGARACHVACGDGGACPSGWACGTDLVCRKPSGIFVATPVIVEDVSSLVIGDFDGDGHKDVMTRGTGIVRVHYFDTLGAQTATTVLSIPRGNVLSGDLASGSSSVVVFDSEKAQDTTVRGTGIDVFRGASNRTLSPVLFESTPIPGATDARTFAAHVIAQSKHPGADDILVLAESTQGPFGILAYFAEGGQFDPMAFVGHAPGALIVNDVPVGPIPPAACDSAILGYKGGTTVTIVRTCADATNANLLAPDGGAGAFAPTTFDFLDPIGGPVLLYDTDKDGNLDMVTSAGAPAPAGTIDLLKGDGSGGFVASRTVGPTKGILWAIGDVDGDGQTDGVDDEGLLLSKTSARYSTADAVTYAQIRDINHDGFIDAVAMTINGIDVWLGTGTASPNHRYYNIPNTKFMTLGDADGDSNLDILVASDPQGATLSIMWGNYGAYPSEPSVMGSVGATQHLSSGKFTWFFGEPSDSLASFVDMTTDGTSISVVPIRGRADRQLTAPYVLSTGPTLSDRSNPITGTMSAVPNDAGVIVPSVSMLAAKAQEVLDASAGVVPMTFWTAHSTPATPASVLDPNDLIRPPVDDAGVPLVALSVSTNGANTAGIAAIDLDPSKNDGDELVVVVPGEQLAVAKLAVTSAGTVWQPQASQPFTGGAPYGKAVKVLPGDFDGDGLRDVLVVFAGPSPSAPISATVYFNDGKGGLGSPISVPVEGALAVTTVHALASALTQVAAVGPNGLQLFSGPKLVALPSATTLSFPSAIDLAAGDANGDGLEDLVVASRTGQVSNFQVLLGTVSQ